MGLNELLGFKGPTHLMPTHLTLIPFAHPIRASPRELCISINTESNPKNQLQHIFQPALYSLIVLQYFFISEGSLFNFHLIFYYFLTSYISLFFLPFISFLWFFSLSSPLFSPLYSLSFLRFLPLFSIALPSPMFSIALPSLLLIFWWWLG